MTTAGQLRIIGNGSGAYIYQKQSFAGKKRLERVGFWDTMDGRNYAACVSCGTINHFDNNVGDSIYFDRQKFYGSVASCIVCLRCDCHFYIVIEDWVPELTENHKKIIRIVRRGLGPHLKIAYFNRHLGPYARTVVSVNISSGRHATVHERNRGGYFIETWGLDGKFFESYSDWEPAVRKMIKVLKEHAETVNP
jgi:hypothetical protein